MSRLYRIKKELEKYFAIDVIEAELSIADWKGNFSICPDALEPLEEQFTVRPNNFSGETWRTTPDNFRCPIANFNKGLNKKQFLLLESALNGDMIFKDVAQAYADYCHKRGHAKNPAMSLNEWMKGKMA